MVQKMKSFFLRWLTIFNLFVFFLNEPITGQDIHFTLFNSSPLYLNPANTGNFNGDWRLTGTYRNQWSALSDPFSTAAVGFDKQFYLLNQTLAFGLTFINDESGSVALSVNELFGSLSYKKVINHNVFYFKLLTMSSDIL